MNLKTFSEHLRTPLYRNSYALVANTVVSSGLGVLYWLVAARLFADENVGINAAMISAMIFLAKLAQFNLVNGLNRFVPAAGRDTRRLIATSYLVAIPLAGVAALIFVAGLGVWAPDLQVIRDSVIFVAAFVAATMAWAVFVLQDAALTGLRRATWVLAENSFFGLAKIALLVALVVAAPRIGIFASWTLPLLLIIIPVNWLLFRRAVPRHVSDTRTAANGVDARAIARFVTADFAASFGWMVPTNLMPVIVLTLAGAEANAYFYLSWTIANALFAFARSTGMSLITEVALDPEKLWPYSRRVLAQTSGLVVPVAAGLVLFAPYVLQLFGSNYSNEGATVLRLLVTAAVANVIISLYAAILRIERRMRALSILYFVLGSLVVSLSFLLIRRVGIAGVGWAWVSATTLIAVVLLATEMRPIWLPVAKRLPIARRLAARLGRGRHGTSIQS
jgi:O-antigen/teichoic acid export membrane protein